MLYASPDVSILFSLSSLATSRVPTSGQSTVESVVHPSTHKYRILPTIPVTPKRPNVSNILRKILVLRPVGHSIAPRIFPAYYLGTYLYQNIRGTHIWHFEYKIIISIYK